MPKATPNTFANHLRTLRETAHLTQAELADASGVSQPTLSQLEAGKCRPSWETIQALCDVFEVSTDTFRTNSREAQP